MPADADTSTWNEWGGSIPSYIPIPSTSSTSSTSHTPPNPALLRGTSNIKMTYAKALGKTPIQATANKDTVPSTRTLSQRINPTTDPKVITLVINKGSSVPVHQPNIMRDKINKAMGKVAISRIHTSPKNNIVLTCFKSTPEEMLLNKPKWEKVFHDWPISKIQQVECWPTVVVHSVPSYLPITSFAAEVTTFNDNITVQGVPRWLTGIPKTAHGSVVLTLGSEDEKDRVLKSGILIGGMLLKTVNYVPNTSKILCKTCLKYGHHFLTCKRQPVCAFCKGGHLSSSHKCSTCKASVNCEHHPSLCYNCNSSSHNTLEKQNCEFYKALS